MVSGPRLIVHVGQTKAGSTALQNYLGMERARLRECGVLFPRTGFSRANPFNRERTSGHLDLVRKIAKGEVDRLDAEREAAKCPVIVLSAENLFLDRPEREINALRTFFEEHSVTIVLVARDLAEWLRSLHVEKVVSGFFSSTQTFAEFCDAQVARGEHDYAARLDRVVGLLGAREVRVINYEAAMAGEGLVTVFLKTAGLPVTDPDLARSIRANLREKQWFLVEGKRRLNHATGALSRMSQLKLEAEIRVKARAIAAALPPDLPCVSAAPTPLSPGACLEAAESNRRLVRDFGLSPPLPDPLPAPADRYQHRRRLQGADDLLTFGLKTAARLSRSETGKDAADNAPATVLGAPGSELVIDLLARATVSLHMESAETAVWAAGHTGKLPIMMAAQGDARRTCDRLLALKLPSEIVCIAHLGMLDPLRRRHPLEAIVVAADVAPERIAAAWAFAAETGVLALTGRSDAAARDVAERLDLVAVAMEGETLMLARRDGARTGFRTGGRR